MSMSPMGDGISGMTTLPTFSDSEALILIDIVFVKAKKGSSEELSEDMQIASIQFNNLDVVGRYFFFKESAQNLKNRLYLCFFFVFFFGSKSRDNRRTN